MVKQKYVRYKIVLTYFDQHFHHHVKLELTFTIGTAAGTPVTILQAQNQLDPMVMNNLLHEWKQ
jgi:hypothetical protein